MTDSHRVLFAGRLGTQSLRVWVEEYGTGIRLLSHELGPALQPIFGEDELETFLEVDGSHLPALIVALRAERTGANGPTDALGLLADKYRGDSAATTAFRDWLTEHDIPYSFAVI